MFTAGRRRYLALAVWALVAAIVCLPWALATWLEYGTPFLLDDSLFRIQLFVDGSPLHAGQYAALASFTRSSNMPEILRVKFKSLLLIAMTSTMIVGLPIVLGLLAPALLKEAAHGRGPAIMVATIFAVFVLATLKQVADVTQVLQLGRYYLPVFAIALPAGIAGHLWVARFARGRSGACGG